MHLTTFISTKLNASHQMISHTETLHVPPAAIPFEHVVCLGQDAAVVVKRV